MFSYYTVVTQIPHTIYLSDDGLQCMEAIGQRKKQQKVEYDLIFLDLHMPVMDGIDAAYVVSLPALLSSHEVAGS